MFTFLNNREMHARNGDRSIMLVTGIVEGKL